MAEKKPAPARRAEIVAAARQLVAMEGAGALSLRLVASSVGIKLASLQYHFPTRAELITALVEDMLARHVEAINHLREKSRKDPEKTLDIVLRWYTIDSSNDRENNQLEVQFWALAQIDETARSALTDYHNLYVAFLAELIQDAVSVSTNQATERAISIASLLEGSILFVDLAEAAAPGHGKSKTIYKSVCAIAYGHM
jgi:AcrR family transcriptional regulator